MAIEQLLAGHALATVFGVVLAHHLGIPVPAFPVLLWAGSKAIDDPWLAAQALVVAVVAGPGGNLAWFWAGRRYGYRVLKLLCRITISPDSCVRQAENAFERRGAAILLIGRFVPGVGMVAPPLAGALGLGIPAFLGYDAAGAALWAGAGLALGLAFHGQIDFLLDWLATLGGGALLLVGVAVALYLGYRFVQRWLFLRSLRVARISAQELYEMMSRGDDPVVLDVRSQAHRRLDGRQIPRARAVDLDDIERTLAEIPRGRDVIVYCACPNEATAAKVAMQLRARGFRRVRPLAGGLDGWVSAGLAVDTGRNQGS